MATKKQLTIKVEIADKIYKMTIDPQDEEKVRRAAKRIQEEIKKLRRKFDATYVDFVAMAALQISIENETNIEKLTFSTERLQIEEITNELEQLLDHKSVN